VVILPSCDDGNIPHRKNDNAEEERRLLYVALTRSRRDLYIYHLALTPTSFLVQAKWATILKSVAQIRSALSKPPATWSLDELWAVSIAVPQLGLLDYLQGWHRWPRGGQHEVAQTVCAFFQRVETMGLSRQLRLPDTAVSAWRAWLEPGTPVGQIEIAGLDAWLSKQRQGTIKAPPPRSQPTVAIPAKKAARSWQVYDEVRHPQHGKGIVVSTTTTQRGRELKVQFVDGSLHNFREDDPMLQGG
jgi:hypothetical protein